MDQSKVTLGNFRFEGVRIWDRQSIQDSQWQLSLPDLAKQELQALREKLDAGPIPAYREIRPADYVLQHTREFMMEIVKKELDYGVGIVVIDKLPIEGMSNDGARAMYWIVSSLLARPICQNHAGNMMMDVRDAGATLKAGTAARGSASRESLDFHTDGAATPLPPRYVGLLMLNDAKLGGESCALSVERAHNWLSERYPNVLPRLYRDFSLFRMREHDPADSPFLSAPFFSFRGEELGVRLGPYQMKSAFEMGAAELDDETADAIAAMDDLFAQDSLVADFSMKPGQVQYLNNRVVAHGRTEFEDWPEPERKRHLFRIWLRDEGDTAYNAMPDE
jgi:hypothetical protein